VLKILVSKDSLSSHLKEMGEISLFFRVLEKLQASLKVLPQELGNFPHISTWVNGLKVSGKALSLLTYLFSPSCFVSKPHLFTNLPTSIQIAGFFFSSPCKKLARQKVRCQNTLRPQNNCFNAWVPNLTPTCSILRRDEGLQVQI
jgi:hypothetical protein